MCCGWSFRTQPRSGKVRFRVAELFALFGVFRGLAFPSFRIRVTSVIHMSSEPLPPPSLTDEYSPPGLRRAAMIRIALLLALLPIVAVGAESRDTKVRNDRTDVMSTGHWIYNDFAKGVAEAKQAGKPLLLVLRCVP
jgi:hypothetical protein